MNNNKTIIITALTIMSLHLNGTILDDINDFFTKTIPETAETVYEKTLKPAGETIYDAGETVYEKAIKPAGETIYKEAIKPAGEAVSTAYQAVVPDAIKKPLLDITNKLQDGATTTVTVVQGTIETIGEIKPLINAIENNVNAIKGIVGKVEVHINQIATSHDPFAIVDQSLETASSLLSATDTLDQTVQKMAQILSIVGSKIVKPLDSKTGTTMQTTSQEIHKIRAKVYVISQKLRQSTIPQFKISNQKIKDNVNEIVKAVNNTKF